MSECIVCHRIESHTKLEFIRRKRNPGLINLVLVRHRSVLCVLTADVVYQIPKLTNHYSLTHRQIVTFSHFYRYH